jgi:hypothetical protein
VKEINEGGMVNNMDITRYWQAVLNQDPDLMRLYFHKNAYINWHNTNEHFNVDGFIRANCEYPGDWDGEIERLETIGNLIVTVAHVWTKEKDISFHVTSFMRIVDDKIQAIDEYWSEDGSAPKWRKDLDIGTKIT